MTLLYMLKTSPVKKNALQINRIPVPESLPDRTRTQYAGLTILWQAKTTSIAFFCFSSVEVLSSRGSFVDLFKTLFYVHNISVCFDRSPIDWSNNLRGGNGKQITFIIATARTFIVLNQIVRFLFVEVHPIVSNTD